MASARIALVSPILTRSLCRQCARTATRRRFADSIIKTQPSHPRSLGPAFTPVRWHSAPASNTKVYEFDQIKQIAESPSPERILIDVREPSEVSEGHIPTSLNIPIKSQPDALLLPAEEFEDRFGFAKPDVDKEVVFYCRSGVRSNAAAQIALQAGYGNVAEYRGSWLDWVERGGVVGRS